MGQLIVAAAQLTGSPGQRPNSRIVHRLIRLLDEAADHGTSLIVYPELALSGYFPSRPYPGADDARAWFQNLPDDLTQPLFSRADQRSVDMVLPFAEWAGGRRYNAAAVYKSGEGVAGIYRKVHTPQSVSFPTGTEGGHETDWFSHGDRFPVFDLGTCVLGVQICYDRHLPESTRSLALQGAQVVAMCSSSRYHHLPSRAETWDMLCRTRAYENTVFIVASNKVGEEDGRDHMGRSCVVSPTGEILSQANVERQDSVVIAPIDLDEVDAVRRTRRFLDERRPEAYESVASYRDKDMRRS